MRLRRRLGDASGVQTQGDLRPGDKGGQVIAVFVLDNALSQDQFGGALDKILRSVVTNPTPPPAVGAGSTLYLPLSRPRSGHVADARTQRACICSRDRPSRTRGSGGLMGADGRSRASELVRRLVRDIYFWRWRRAGSSSPSPVATTS